MHICNVHCRLARSHQFKALFKIIYILLRLYILIVFDWTRTYENL